MLINQIHGTSTVHLGGVRRFLIYQSERDYSYDSSFESEPLQDLSLASAISLLIWTALFAIVL